MLEKHVLKEYKTIMYVLGKEQRKSVRWGVEGGRVGIGTTSCLSCQTSQKLPERESEQFLAHHSSHIFKCHRGLSLSVDLKKNHSSEFHFLFPLPRKQSKSAVNFNETIRSGFY